MALSILDHNGPTINVMQLAPRDTNIEENSWSNKPLISFFSAESASSPCLTSGTPEDWRSFQNNNLHCERLVGYVKSVVLDKKVKDSFDHQCDDKISSIDIKIRNYVIHSRY